jgi:cysteine desulfurase/selenocysteine lyase
MRNLEKIRSDFPILTQKIHGHPLVYLDNSATTQKPKQVIDSIVSFYNTSNGNVHRSGYSLSQSASNLYESSRQRVKKFIDAETTEQIIFTSGTTESINLVAHSFGKNNVTKGDEIIISEMEHHSNIVPWQQLCKEKKAVLKIIPFNDDGVLLIDQFEKMLNKKTKLVALTFVSNTLGTINPIREIIKIAHDFDVPVLVDAAQAVPHFRINVHKLDCDFFVFSGHKMYAGTGVGVLYAKQKWLEIIPPFKYGGGMVDSVSFEKTTFSKPPLKFEAGTSNISAVISLGKAIEYLTKIGIKSINEHEHDLLFYALDQLGSFDGLTIYGNPPQRCSIISFNLKHVHHYDAMMILDKLGIAVRSGKHCAEPVMHHYKIPGTIRASFALYNTKEEIDILIKGIKKVQEMFK